MSIAPELKKLVDEEDLIQIRCFLANYLIVDRTFVLFDESLAEVSAQLPIIQEFDGGVLEEDSSRWNTDYLDEQIVALFSNFSQKRIDHTKDVVRAVVNEKPTNSNIPENLSERGVITTPKTGRTIISEREMPTRRSTPPTKHSHASPDKQEDYSTATSSKTGRRVVSETEIVTETKPVTPAQSHGGSVKAEVGTSRTGRRVLSEAASVADTDSDEDSVHRATSDRNNTVGTAMMVGGAALAAVGVVLSKPVVIVAGGAVAGAGVIVTVANKRR